MSEYIKQFDTPQGPKKVDFQALGNFPACQPGQMLKVTAVDENGQPTAWEAGTVDAYTKAESLSDSTKALYDLEPDAVPDDVLKKMKGWSLLAEYDAAGSYEFVVPSEYDELGVLMVGGGGSGGSVGWYAGTDYCCVASGGGSGDMATLVLSKADGDFSAGESIAVVVGAGGEGVTAPYGSPKSGNAGGSSAFGGHTVDGGGGGNTQTASGMSYQYTAQSSGGNGQPSDAVTTYASTAATNLSKYAPVGFYPYYINHESSAFARSQVSAARNPFDAKDAHEYCGAGGGVWSSSGNADKRRGQPTSERQKGHAGAGAYSITDTAFVGNSATAPGDGGGGVATSVSNGKPTSGAGHDGLVLVYGGVN